MELAGARPELVAPEVHCECGIACLIVGIASECDPEIIQCPDVVPAVRADLGERRDHNSRLEHVVEDSLEQFMTKSVSI
jgi:hypothetical protein